MKTLLALLIALSLSAAGLLAAGTHAADDELALAAAQLIAAQNPGAPAAGLVTANLEPTDSTTAGKWSATVSWTPHIPVSAAVLPDGRLLTFASNQRTTFPVGPEFTYAATWNPSTGVFQEFNNPSHDMFCGGMAMLADGRVMVNGGRNEVTSSSVFDWRTNTWSRVQNMNGGRWYNTTVAYGNSEAFTATGSGTGQRTAEKWSAATGWSVLTGVPWGSRVLDPELGYVRYWHPFISVAPDGRLMHFGPTDQMHWITTAGSGSITDIGLSVPGVHYPKEGIFAMYDEGKVLVAGGSTSTIPNASDSSTGNSTTAAYTVDMTMTPPTIASAASMAYARQFANAVVIPSGEVLVMGGNTSGLKFNDTGSVMPCELWNPRTRTWRTVASISVPRNYHSVALMLPDGRVWLGGGGLGGADHRDAQLYTPPNLLNSSGTALTRPVLNTAPTKIGPGMTFKVEGTAGLAKFAFIRLAALTHSVNTDQRYLSLPFTETSAGNYDVVAHSNLNVLTPGYWMLFGIMPSGVYSVSKIIQVDPTSAVNVINPGPQTHIIGQSINLQIQATAPGSSALTYSATGLPTGLSIHPSTGLITGTVTTGGIFTTRVSASAGAQIAVQEIIWCVHLAHPGSGSILREWWLGIGGATLADLTGNAAYAATPTGKDQRALFEAPTDWAENHGQRMRGFLHPPVTGQYRFWIASDDEGRLSLSSNREPANASIIARVPSWTAAREWTKFGEQFSAYITLQAGQSYYIEALMKEGGGGDNLAVAWQIPGSTGPVVIDGQYLSPWQDNRPPVLTNPGNQVHVRDFDLVLNVQASDADNDVLAFSATGLPQGLSINANSGAITGRATSAGATNVTVRVADSRGATAAVTFTWVINEPFALNAFPALAPAASGSSVNITVGSTGGANVRFQWNWGDGTPVSGFSTSGTASHTYVAPGRYEITLTTTDNTGRMEISTFYQAIHAPLTARKPTASSSILFEDRATGNDRVWSVNQDNDSVSVFDAVTRTRLAEIAVGKAPRTLALAPNGRVWVANVESATLSLIDASTLAVAQTVTLPRGSRPYGIAVDPDGSDVWVACEGTGQLLRFNPANAAQHASVNVGANARHVAISADGARVFVSRFITPLLPGESTASIDTTNAGAEVLSVLTSNLSFERTVLLKHSERPDTQNTGRGIPNYLGPAVISPDGLTAWVPSKQDNIKRGALRDGLQLTHDQTVRSIASRIALTNGAPASSDDTANRVDFDNAGIAVNGVFDGKGLYFFTALEGSREVAIVDVWNKREIRRFSAGRAPQGIAVSPDGRTIYVQNFLDRSVTVHDVGAIMDGQTTTPTLVATLGSISTEKLSPTVLRGKQLFHDTADPRIAFQQYISCAACHNEGGQDGRVWDFTQFGEGLRNSITLRGHGGTAQGPLHWTGNFDEVQDFENQLRGLAGGTGLIENGNPHPSISTANAGLSADLDALAGYVASLTKAGDSPHRASTAPTSETEAGRVIFERENCASCHSGTGFTNSALNVFADIGTLKPSSGQRLGAALTGLDVPTLRGLFNTAPYLHDGSAATLEAAVLAHRGVSLGGADLAHLAEYLRNLDDAVPSAPAAVPATLQLLGTAIVGQPFSVQVVFASPLLNSLTNHDLVLTNASLLGITGSGTTWVATVQSSLPEQMTVKLANGASPTLSTDVQPAWTGTADDLLALAVKDFRIEHAADGSLVAVLLRPKVLPQVSYNLEGSADLVAWATQPLTPQVFDQGDNTERVEWRNWTRNLLRVRVIHEQGAEATTVPCGAQRLALQPGNQTLGVALLRAPILSTLMLNAADNLITVSGSAIHPGVPCYAEIASGPQAGHRFDVQSIQGTTLTLDLTSPHNTLPALPTSLAGEKVIVRPHQTLAQVFAHAGFIGSGNPQTAEQVLFYRDGRYVSYWLYDGGGNAQRRAWLQVGDATLTPMNDLILPPGTGVMVKLVSARSFTLVGQVRTNAFVQKLDAGHQLIASPWPVNASPTSLRMMIGNGFTGGTNAQLGEQLQTWLGDMSSGASGYGVYWLHSSSNHWLASGDATLTPMENQSLLLASRAVFLKTATSGVWVMQAPQG